MNTTPKPQNLTSILAQIDSLCEEYLIKKAPFSLPENAKDLIVKIMPYASLVMAIMLLPVILAAFGLTALPAPFAMMANYANPLTSLWGIVSFLVSLLGIFFWFKAIPGLFAKSKAGWTNFFYGILVNAVNSLLSMDIGQLILGSLVILYLLYQVKSYYTK